MIRVLLLSVLLLLSSPVRVSAQEAPGIEITSPTSGQVVQGQVVVTGTNAVLGFNYYELSFAYMDDPTDTWFLLQSSSLPVVDGELGSWPTSGFSDGDYSLRLRVYLLDGSVMDTIVTDLRVRNAVVLPTATLTPTPTATIFFSLPTAQLATSIPSTATATYPAPTSLPPNPVTLTREAIYVNIGLGALMALLLIVIFGFFLRIRRS